MALRRLTALLLLCVSLSGLTLVSAQETPLKVVATYSILGDIVQNIAGDNIDLTVLVGPDSDSHAYEPTPQDAIALAEADLIFENGLEFESWLDELYTASGSTATRVVVSEGIEPLALVEGAHDDEHEDEHAEEIEITDFGAMARLAVNDYESGTVNIIDLTSGDVVSSYDLSARSTLYTSHNGRYAYAVQGNGNVVNVIDSGLSQIWHDDHYDMEIGDIALLDFAVEGPLPIHFVMWEEQVSVFNDGDGTVVIFNENDMSEPDAAMVTLTAERPHHGVGVAVGEHVLLSLPNLADADDSLPIGIGVYTLAGEEIERFENCPGLHGEAHAGNNGMAFACSDGILIINWIDGTFTATKIDYPSDAGDLRSGTLSTAHGGQYVVGNFGETGFIRIDAAAGTIERFEVPAESWRFAVSEEDPSILIVLTLDGSLHVVDIASGTIEGSVQVVEPFTRPSRAAARPVFALNGHMAYVSDPLPGDIAIVNLETFEVAEERLFVGGKPSSMTAFGVMGEDHHAGEDHEDEDSHDHEDEHEHGEYDPHIWHDPINGLVMVENIHAAFVAADPAHAAEYDANAEAYSAELTALDTYIREQVAAISEDRRILVTSHDTFGYLADEYGFVISSALGSFSTEAADPSAGEIAELITEIQTSGVPAIFAENIANPDLIQMIADEAGVAVAPTLYTDALGQSGTPGETYLGLLRYNIDTIVEALK